ncbi:Ig-like domain-containing protein [Leifsonia sp. NPDC058194]|uniref:Ig-like domain-containing protein n=1 Tax=Leifsonia sp. NPDC058194 TaxID=3346374 RepID=UPI0036DBD4D6
MVHARRGSTRRTIWARVTGSALSTLLVAGALIAGAGASPASADFTSQCAAPTRTVAAGATSISVAAGETVLVAADFTGGVDALPAGSTLCVGAGATLTGSYLNNPAGALVVASGATLVMPSVAVNAGFSLDVEGTATFAGLAMNGNGIVTVASGARFTVNGSLSSAAGSFQNSGTFTVQGAFDLNSGVAFDNSGILSVHGGAAISGPLTNSGIAGFQQGLTINSSGALQNTCAISATGDLINNSANASNAGLVIASGVFTNNGGATWAQSNRGVARAAGLRDDGAIVGLGRYSFSGTTSVQGSFTGASAADPITVQSVAPAGQIFDTATGSVTNTVRGTVNLLDPFPSCGASTTPSADVEVQKVGPATVLENGTVTYTVTVVNHGPGAADDVVLSDTLPAGFALDPASTTGTVNGGVLSWQVGTLASGASATFTFSGTATAPAGTVLVNTARSTSSTPDTAPSNNDGSSAGSTVDTEVIAVPPPVNNPPVADDLVLDTSTGLLALGRVTATDPDAGQKLTYSTVTRPAHGSMYFSSTGGFVYVSDNDFSGVDTFEYQVCDNASPTPACDTATVTINVYPRALADAAQTFEDTPVTIPLTDNDTAGAPLDGTVVTGPLHGTVSLDPATGDAVYTPDAGYTGQDAFDYRICSPTAPDLCATAHVTIDVLPPNVPPTIDPLTQVTTTNVATTDTVTTDDANPDAVLTDYQGVPPRSGVASVAPDGTVVYTPRTGFAGRDEYTVIVCDDGTPQLCATGVVHVEVYPVATPDSAVTAPGTAVDIDVLGNDDGTVDPPTIATPPGHGTVTFTGGVAHYVPAPGFSGTDTFRYTICANGQPDLCSTTTVTVTVQPAVVVPPVGPGGSGGSGGSGPAGGTGSGLADTGSDATGPLVLGLTVLAAGMVLVASRLRRRRRA